MKLQTPVSQLIASKGIFTISLRMMQLRLKIFYVQIGKSSSKAAGTYFPQS